MGEEEERERRASPTWLVMGFLACAGYTLIGAGPPAAVFIEFVVSSPFILLVSLASPFFWVTVLLAISMVWQVGSTIAFGLGGKYYTLPSLVPLVCFLCCEELLRPLVHKFSTKAVSVLDKRAVQLRHPKLTYLEKLRIQLGIGAGQGIAHSCLFFLNTVATSYRGTYYSQRCSQMPYFLVAAISSSTVFIVLSFAMVVTGIVFGLDASSSSSSRSGHTIKGLCLKLVPFGMHAICTLISLLNLINGGCVASSVANVLVTIGAVVLTGKLALSPQVRTYQ